MPRLTQYHVPEIRELGRQLMYAPAEAKRRHMEAAESLASEIVPDRIYPREFIIYRITSYRPEMPDPPGGVVGEALLSDLVTLVQRLSESLDVAPDDRGRCAIRFDEVPRRLNISSKTLQRYRREGLVCHYVVFDDGIQRLACFEDALSRFVEGHADRVARAASFSRVDRDLQQRLIAEAAQLQRAEGVSLNTAAKRLAARHGRAHETVRSVLRRHDLQSDQPLFADRGPLQARAIRRIHRAVMFGIPIGALAARFGKTRATIHRALNGRRGELLAGLELDHVSLPTLERPDAEAVILAAPGVVSGLRDGPVETDAIELIEACRRADPVEEQLEHALVAGRAVLRRRASKAIAALPEYPGSAALDRIETDLRWATLLKRRLVGLGLPAAICAAEQTLGRPLAEQPSEEIRAVLAAATSTCAEVAETLDPTRGHRLATRCGFEMDRRLAAGVGRSRGRAATRHRGGSVPLGPLWTTLDTWQRWLDLRPDLEGFVPGLEREERELLESRFGLDGTPPRSIAELGKRMARPPSTVAAALHRAEAALLSASRTGTDDGRRAGRTSSARRAGGRG